LFFKPPFCSGALLSPVSKTCKLTETKKAAKLPLFSLFLPGDSYCRLFALLPEPVFKATNLSLWFLTIGKAFVTIAFKSGSVICVDAACNSVTFALCMVSICETHILSNSAPVAFCSSHSSYITHSAHVVTAAHSCSHCSHNRFRHRYNNKSCIAHHRFLNYTSKYHIKRLFHLFVLQTFFLKRCAPQDCKLLIVKKKEC
jgi:hypothetical protein